MESANTDEAILKQLTNFEPLITTEQIDEAETFEKDGHTRRRLMLFTLTKGSEELFKMAEKDPDATEELFYYLTEYTNTIKSLLSMSEACCTRLMASLMCIEDEERVKAIGAEWANAVDMGNDG